MSVRAQTVPAPRAQAVPAARLPWGFAEFFVISQTALPAILILPGTQAIRLPIRASAFLVPLAAFVWWNVNSEIRTVPSKTQSWLFSVMFLLSVMVFHPSTPSIAAGVAHAAVYFAVMTPLFWAPALVRTPDHLARLIWLLLVCSGVNALVGVLQVYDPGRWMPAEFSRMLMSTAGGLEAVSYIGAQGQLIVRPPGLFDTPGAVSGPAAYAALLGLIFAVSALPAWQRLVSLGFAGAGLAAIYLTQVRAALVITVGMMVVYAVVATRRGRVGRATQFATLAGAIVVGSFTLAVALGGASISDRIFSLFANDPLTVYHGARGVQLQATFSDLLYRSPLGSGLGRWGMTASYFGSSQESMFAEIQFTGWMIDGGVLMIALYLGALTVTTLSQYRVAGMRQYPKVAQCGAVVLAANLGTAALIFSFVPFVTQVGVQYWFLAGALHGVSQRFGVDGA